MKPRLLIYSDCPVLGGADTLALDLLADPGIRAAFETRFVYRDAARFGETLAAKGGAGAPTRTVSFPDRIEIVERVEAAAGRLAALPVKLALRLADFLLFPYDALRLWAAFRAEKPDLVHINDGGYPGALGARAAALAARLAGARVVFAVHNQTRPLTLPGDLMDLAVDPLVDRCADVFVTASKTAKASLAGRGFAPERIEIIPDGVKDASLRPTAAGMRAALGLGESERVFVTTAFFEPRKGHRVLLDAAARLTRRGVGVPRLVFIGDGPERPAVEAEAARLGLGVLFLGYRADAADVLRAADGFILPSIGSEDMPLAILDAMALSKPVIATRLAGIPDEVADGETGILVEPGDAHALSSALETLTSDAGLGRRMGEAGRRRFLELFESSRMCAGYAALYARTLKA